MKRITAIIFCVMVFIFSATPLSAFAEKLPPSVADDAGLLTDVQIEKLTETLDNLRDVYKMDVSVVTTPSVSAGQTVRRTALESAMKFADDYFDYNGYGCGENDDGIMLVVSKNPRVYHFTTHSRGIEVFNDKALKYMEEEMVSYLKNDNYYGAFVKFADNAEYILRLDANGEKFKYTPKIKYLTLLAAFIVPLVLAFIITFIQYKKMNDAVFKAAANEYAKGNVNTKAARDIFLYSAIHKTPRPKNNGSGGSSVHRSSSGRTHGGRGGSY